MIKQKLTFIFKNGFSHEFVALTDSDSIEKAFRKVIEPAIRDEIGGYISIGDVDGNIHTIGLSEVLVAIRGEEKPA